MELRDIIEAIFGCTLVLWFVVAWVQGVRESGKERPPIMSLSHEEIQIARWRIIHETFQDWD